MELIEFNQKSILIICILIVAVVLDLISRKLSNRFVAGTLIISVLYVFITNGLVGLSIASFSMAAAFLLGLPLYYLKAIGGGDYKFFIAISPLFDSWDVTAMILFSALIWGALLGIIKSILNRDFARFISNLVEILFCAFSKLKSKSIKGNKESPYKLKSMNLNQIPFSVAFLFGFLTAITLSQVGIKW